MTGRPRRRDLLRAGAAAAALAALPGCDPLATFLPRLRRDAPARVGLPAGEEVDPVHLLLSRTGYGPRPGEIEEVRALGRDAWIDRQLRPATIDDAVCDWRIAGIDCATDSPTELQSVAEETIDRDLVRLHLLRAVHSERRLLETMVGFWSDHLSIQMQKRGCRRTKPWDDREVVRRHALGRFRDLIGASARSPAMLRYLDNAENRRRSPSERPNENYARELLELHTLGVRGGYSQTDVMEAARCLTGWTVDDDPGLGHALREIGMAMDSAKHDAAARVDVVFRRDWHDDGEKVVLGVRIPAGGGERDLADLLDIVCAHPSTARHVARKLVRRFVADDPPAALIDSAAAEFSRSGGDIAAVMRHILTSDAFAASAGAKTRRPFDFVVAALRALDADADATPEELRFLERLGHVPFGYPTPDGYPEEPEPWMGTLLWRWNFALALTTGRLGGTTADLESLARRAGLDPGAASPAELAPLLYGRAATAGERAAVDAYVARPGGAAADRRAEAVALLLAAPAFQVT